MSVAPAITTPVMKTPVQENKTASIMILIIMSLLACHIPQERKPNSPSLIRDRVANQAF
jgi:hypothetical protein